MSKFWQKKYISKYTGKEIDDAIGQVIEGGGGGDDIAFVGITSTESSTVCELTLNEVGAIIESGKQVFFNVNEGESIAPGQTVFEDFGCITYAVNPTQKLLVVSTFIFDEDGATGKEMIRTTYSASLT